MFKWFKALVSGSSATTQASQEQVILPADIPRQTPQVATVWQVVDQFLKNNPAPTPFGVHALVDAGAANLLGPTELFQACDKIQEHGYQFPLNPTLVNEMEPREILEFIRWHADKEIEQECYANEATIRELVGKYRTHR